MIELSKNNPRAISVSCDQPVIQSNKEINEAIDKGYLLVAQIGWVMFYEHPDLSYNVLERHKNYIEFLIKYDKMTIKE